MTMKTSRKTMATMFAAAGLALVTSVAYAFPPGAGPCGAAGSPGYGRGAGPGMHGGGPGMRGGQRPGPAAGAVDPAAQVDARLNMLRGELKISDSQQAAWDAFANAAKARAGAMVAMRTQMQSAPAQSGHEHFAQRADFAKQRAAAMESMSTAVKDLYAALTPEQKAIADQRFGARGGPAGRGMGRGYGPGAGHGYGPRW